MNLDELQSVQSSERQTDSLQQLRDSFYEEAGRFIRQLREERAHVAANADDPFDSPDVRRLSNEIETAERTVEAIYERRIGKVVKQASLEAAGMGEPAEEGLTTEERDAFTRIVETIEENREYVLEEVLANERTEQLRPNGEATQSPSPDRVQDPPAEPAGETSPKSRSASGSDDTDEPAEDHPVPPSAADVMGDASSAADMLGDGGDTVAQESPQSARTPTEAMPDPDLPEQPNPAPTEPPGEPASHETNGRPNDSPAVDRATIRITREVGPILGVDDREYDLSTDDIVTLPETNVKPLLEKDAAVRLD